MEEEVKMEEGEADIKQPPTTSSQKSIIKSISKRISKIFNINFKNKIAPDVKMTLRSQASNLSSSPMILRSQESNQRNNELSNKRNNNELSKQSSNKRGRFFGGNATRKRNNLKNRTRRQRKFNEKQRRTKKRRTKTKKSNM